MYPWIIDIHGSSTCNVVAIPVIQKYYVSMDYPWLSTVIHGQSDIQCGSHTSNSEIQCIHGFSGRVQHPMVATSVIQECNA